jgi:hypothetical protein
MYTLAYALIYNKGHYKEHGVDLRICDDINPLFKQE